MDRKIDHLWVFIFATATNYTFNMNEGFQVKDKGRSLYYHFKILI